MIPYLNTSVSSGPFLVFLASQNVRKSRIGRRIVESAFILAVFTGAIAFRSDFERFDFHRKEWIRATRYHQRGAIVEDLLRKQMLIGLSRPEIIDLLGVPDNSTKDTMTYFLGRMGRLYGSRNLYFVFRGGIRDGNPEQVVASVQLTNGSARSNDEIPTHATRP